MLKKLSISNFAIIRHLVLEPVQGLNIITGETGAGKSILLDALELILGSRADIKSQSNWGGKCVIEGEFFLDKSTFETVFMEFDLDFDEITTIRREISANGKARSFVNDTPVSLGVLKSIAEQLVSMHGQHENSELHNRKFQFDLIDTFSGCSGLRSEYSEGFTQWRSLSAQLGQYRQERDAMLREKDYLTFLLDEFAKAELKKNEENEAEEELKVLNHAEQIASVAGELNEAITDSENALVDSLQQLRSRIRSIAELHPSAKSISDRLVSVIAELKDISEEASALSQSVQSDPRRIEFLNERISLIQQLKRKHGAEELDDLFRREEDLVSKLNSMSGMDETVEKLELECRLLKENLIRQADELHRIRVENANRLSRVICEKLNELEMQHADIRFKLEHAEELNEFGSSSLQLLFTANLGMPLQALNKVASGGELSRLALCIRSVEASGKSLSTLVFDEIDTGVSGRVADTIGNMFRKISNGHQVIAVTHLPQVAGYGNAHFYIGKREEEGQTSTYVKKLNPSERVEELAKMLSGNQSTDIAKKNAKQLIKQ